MPAKRFCPVDEVPSFKLCKELKEQDYPQGGGGWYWLVTQTEERKELVSLYFFEMRPVPLAYQEYIKAPTLREVGERLPDKIMVDGFPFYLTVTRQGDVWECYYSTPATGILGGRVVCRPPTGRSSRMPDAYASMWLWLKKSNHLEGSNDVYSK